MTAETPEQLFARFLDDGDERALDALFRRCAPRLRAFALRLGLANDRAEDLVHETLVAAVHDAARYDASLPLLPWLQGILSRKAASLARDDGRRRRREEEWAKERLAKTPGDGEAQPVASAAGAELRELLTAAIASSPERYRPALELSLVHGLPPREVAQRLGRREATVRVHLFRGLRHVRKNLPRGLAPAVLALLAGGRGARAAGAASTRWGGRAALACAAAVGIAVTAWAVLPPAPVLPAEHTNVAAQEAMSPRHEAPLPKPAMLRTAANANPATDATAPTFAVHVVDSAGRAVRGVGVTLEPLGGVDPAIARRRAVTDERGDARFAMPTTLPVLARSDRGGEKRVDDPAATATLTVHGATLRGVVVDAFGHAARGARIWIGTDEALELGGVATTADAAGTFCCEHVPAGAWLGALTDDGITALQQWRGGDVRLQLQPATTVSGRVLGAAGDALVHAVVAIGTAPAHADTTLPGDVIACTLPAQVVRTDERGHFGPLVAPPGELRVHVRAAGHVATTHLVEVAATAVADCELVLPPSTPLRGTVLAQSGEPLPFAEVAFLPADGSARYDLRTDASGAFVLDVAAGTGSLCARAASHVPARCELDPARDPQRVVELRLQPNLETAGRIVHEDGAPAAAWSIRWRPDASSALRGAVPQTTSAADGTFVVPELGAHGDQGVRVRGPGDLVWHDLDAGAVTRANGELHVVVPRRLIPSARLSATCRGVAGQPLQGARVFLQCDRGVAWECAATDAGGAFSVGPLAPGSYWVFVESRQDDQPAIARDGIVLRAHEHATHEFVAGPSGTLAFAIETTTGAPIEAALVSIVGGEPERRYAARAATSGRLRLPVGSYRFYAMGEGFAWIDGAAFTIAADTTTELPFTAEPAARTTLELRDLPAERPCTVHVRRTGDGAAFGTFTLRADAHPSLTAFLPRGTFAVEVVDASGEVTARGELQRSDLAGTAHTVSLSLERDR